MLRPCTERECEKYIDFVYDLAADRSRSGYPIYSDGIKTKEMFEKRSKKAFSSDSEEILLFVYEGVTEGWIHYYFFSEDKYLSAESFCISHHTEQALREFLEYAREHFKGYDLYLGYPADNKRAVDFLAANGFELLEESFNNTAFLDNYKPTPTDDDLVRITEENFDLFRTLHGNSDPDMYWNSDRIRSNIENWSIFVVLRGGEACGSVYYTPVGDGWFEIFGIDMKDNVHDGEVLCDLLRGALNTAKEQGGKYVTFFCGERERDIAEALGFVCVGVYVCYRMHIE